MDALIAIALAALAGAYVLWHLLRPLWHSGKSAAKNGAARDNLLQIEESAD